MRKKASPWLVAAAALLISTGAASDKVHADELVKDETVVSESQEEDVESSDVETVEVGEEEASEVTDSEEVSEQAEEVGEETAEEAEVTAEEVTDAEETTEEETTAEEETGETAEDETEETEEIEDKKDAEAVEVSTDTDAAKADDKKDAEAAKEVTDKDAVKADDKKDAAKADEKKDAEEIKPVVTNEEEALVSKTGWNNINGKWRFYYGTGNYDFYKDRLFEEGGNCYYLDSSGYAQTGWVNYDGNYYYANSSGAFISGWLPKDGVYFYLGSPNASASDSYVTRFAMRSNGIYEIKGDSYYFSKSGIMMTGWASNGSSSYYAGTDGKLVKGWQKVGNNWYHFGYTNQVGENKYEVKGYDMRTYSYTLYGKDYYFGDNGVMKTGWIDRNGTGNTYWYANTSGELVSGWAKIDNKNYFFGYSNYDSYKGWYASGHDMRKNQTYYIEEKPYYFDKFGVNRTGWIELKDGNYDSYYGVYDYSGYYGYYYDTDSVWYYANPKGILQQGWTTVSGKDYFLGNVSNYSDGTYSVTGFAMQKGIKKIGNYGYFFDDYGALKKTGWIEDRHYNSDGSYEGHSWYYAIKDGILAQGWQKIGSDYYFFGDTSNNNYYYLKTDQTLYWKGNYYRVDKNGVLGTGMFEISDLYETTPYYASASGVLQNGWFKIGGKDYYAENGVLARGVKYVDGNYYCFGERGDMRTGWVQTDENTWRFFDSWGVAAKGWRTLSGKKYYFFSGNSYDAGRMADNISYVEGKRYFFENGALATGANGWKSFERVIDINGKKEVVDCYVNKDGTVRTAPMKVSNDVIYAIDSDGELVKNSTLYIDGKLRLTDASGKVIWKKGWQSGKRLVHDDFGNSAYEVVWYYLDPSYTVTTSKIMSIDGATYAFNNYGIMQTGYLTSSIYDPKTGSSRYGLFDENGKEVTGDGWHKVDGSYYYIKDRNVYRGGIYTINYEKYYFDAEGRLYVNTNFYNYHGDERFYKADKDGKLTYLSKGWQFVRDYYDGNQWYDNVWVFLDAEGRCYRDDKWIPGDNGSWYYVDNGRMVTGPTYINDEDRVYVFGEDGKLVKNNFTNLENTTFKAYGDQNGIGYNGILKKGGYSYMVEGGYLEYSFYDDYNNPFVADSNGAIRTTAGWFQRKFEMTCPFTGKKFTVLENCYVDSQGHALEAGWHTIGGKKYYFQNGAALTGTQYLNGQKFVFDAKGALVSSAK